MRHERAPFKCPCTSLGCPFHFRARFGILEAIQSMIMDAVSPAFSRQSNCRIRNQFCRGVLLFIGAILLVWFSALTAMAGTLLTPGQNGSLLEQNNGGVR